MKSFSVTSGKSTCEAICGKHRKTMAKTDVMYGIKVFPHNFRHCLPDSIIWTRKNLVRLADILGHSNVLSTNKGYTMESGRNPIWDKIRKTWVLFDFYNKFSLFVVKTLYNHNYFTTYLQKSQNSSKYCVYHIFRHNKMVTSFSGVWPYLYYLHLWCRF